MPDPIVWRAPVCDPSGYAEDARLFLRGLWQARVPVALQPVTWGERVVQMSDDDAKMVAEFSATAAPIAAVCVNQLFPEQFMWSHDARRRCARILFESDRVPAPWIAALQDVDAIWVASQFNVETFSASGIPAERLRVLPNAVDTEIFCIDGPRMKLADLRSVVFLSVCDFNPRKGLDVLLQAWGNTFTANDDVCLVLKTYSSAGRTAAQIETDIQTYCAALGFSRESLAPIILLSDIFSTTELAALYRRANCFVLPTHGEGWGRTITEAMACGVPVITSRWGAPLDYLHDDNAYLIDGATTSVPDVAVRYNHHFAGHHWFAPDVGHCSELLCRVAGDPDTAQHKAQRAAAEISKKYSVAAVTQQLLALLAE